MKRWLYYTLMGVFAAVFVVSGVLLLDYYSKSQKVEKEYDALAQMVEQARPVQPTDPSLPSQAGESQPETTEPQFSIRIPEVVEGEVVDTQNPWVQVPDPDTGELVSVLPEYSQLYMMNNDLVGWIRIPGTKINYPVMQTPDRVDYYLKRDFYEKKSSHGSIYVRETCDVFAPSDNVTIYGHRMNDGSMFAGLHSYKNESFFDANRYIYFDTLTHRNTYEILAVFLISSTKSSDFQYHLFADAQSPEEFDSFVSQCKKLSLYDTGVEAVYGDKLITLSTCEYSNYNGRLVVVAKAVG